MAKTVKLNIDDAVYMDPSSRIGQTFQSAVDNYVSKVNGAAQQPQQGIPSTYADVTKNNTYEQVTTPGKTNFPSPYTAQADEIYNQIMNRGKFSYDINNDALYQQYRDQYTRMGQQAMQDTMGQAAALTGGYGSTYAESAGQQQYQKYLQELNDIVPELYQNAYQMYVDEGNDLANRYSMAMAQDEREYSRQQDEYNKIYDLIVSTGYKPSDTKLAEIGMTRAQADRLRKLYKSGGSGGGGGGSSSYSTKKNGNGNKNQANTPSGLGNAQMNGIDMDIQNARSAAEVDDILRRAAQMAEITDAQIDKIASIGDKKKASFK